MADIIRVEWLQLKAAVRRFTFPLEKLFLAQVGRRVLCRKTARESKQTAQRRLAAQGRSGKRAPRRLAK